MELLSKDYDVPQDVLVYRSGIMGVPITFMIKYNPAQFDILGKIDSGEITKYNLANPKIGGKTIYKRIAIRRKQVYRNENQTA